MKILLVEDNPENWEMLSRRLKNRGHEVTVAEDGQSALDLANAEAPDLILLDMSLPILSGWDVAKALRAGEATTDIPIIALTAHALDEDRDQALQAGCHEFETKPVDIERLLQKMQILTGAAK
jgi:CheY-like chemotaxis protein